MNFKQTPKKEQKSLSFTETGVIFAQNFQELRSHLYIIMSCKVQNSKHTCWNPALFCSTTKQMVSPWSSLWTACDAERLPEHTQVQLNYIISMGLRCKKTTGTHTDHTSELYSMWCIKRPPELTVNELYSKCSHLREKLTQIILCNWIIQHVMCKKITGTHTETSKLYSMWCKKTIWTHRTQLMSYTASGLKLVKDHLNTTQFYSYTVNELYSKWSKTSKRPPKHYTEFYS